MSAVDRERALFTLPDHGHVAVDESDSDSSTAAVHRADGGVGKGLGIKPGRVFRTPIAPKANGVLRWLRHLISPWW